MNDFAPVLKDENNQIVVPSVWRKTLSEIVDAFINNDFHLARRIVGVSSIAESDAERIERNIRDYGVTLTELPEDTWNTSVCQWMRGYWDVLIDLFTIEEGASDLVLSVRVYEENERYIFEVQSVYVP